MNRPLNVYVASQTKHAVMWRAFRDNHPWSIKIVSSWIDAGEVSADLAAGLWVGCVLEAKHADCVLAYYEPGDDWKGVLVEIGAALASDRHVFVVGEPPGSWVAHPRVHQIASIDDLPPRGWL